MAMAAPVITAGELRRALGVYLGLAYPGGVPAAITERTRCVEGLADDQTVPGSCFEVVSPGGEAEPVRWALRLGQPMYPHMKLMVESCPGCAAGGSAYLLRADAHDAHLHAPPGSPDAAWLAGIRASNKELVEKIEHAWTAEGLRTFRAYLREEVARRKAKG